MSPSTIILQHIDVHTGGGVSVGLDDEGVAAYTDAFDDVASTSDVRDRIVNSDVARDSTDKCDVMSQFASTGKTLIISLPLI